MHRNILVYIFSGCFFLAFAGCGAGANLRPTPSATPTSSQPSPAFEAKTPDSEIETPNPRAIAALTLSDQAKALLDGNKPDQAIRLLEQAINLHPQQGEAYYYLSEAWFLKGNLDQALEFNRLAEIYFKNDGLWAQQVALQKNRIHHLKP